MNKSQQEATACYNPVSGEVIGHSSITSRAELSNVIAKARLAQKTWAELLVKNRTKYVYEIRDWIVGHSDEIAETIHQDNGKSKVDALATEVLSASIAANYYAKNAERFLQPRKLKAGNIILSYKRSRLHRVPFGVVAIISPWNYPFTIPFHEIIIALLSGNAVILKAARETQMVGRKLEECIQSAGLPEGVFNYVNMPGSEFGKAIFEEGIDKLFFTGSLAVGKHLVAASAETLTPVSLELGSNDAMIVCRDADLERAAAGAVWAGLQNSGQSCGGVERVYVHERAYDDFLGILKSYVEDLRPVTSLAEDEYADFGVMTTEEQIAIVNGHIEEAVREGANIVAESLSPENPPEQFISAKVLTNVTHKMAIMREETFGPVLGIMKFRTEREAIDLTNDSNFGLTSSVWSRDKKRAAKIARELESGAVTINDHLMSHGMAETPWGGFKQSGIGRTHGAFGFDEMTEPQVIIQDRLSFSKRALWWHPYSKKLYNGLKSILSLLYGNSITRRIAGLWGALKIIPRIFKRWIPRESDNEL
ncbi:MAG: putative succinate-semialdehyde dehydrogenase [NADP(+)] 2 [Candidatus Marinimicrobia bacterium]|nr:putative succinate-semialdehyde dehydrogenase [NADP(+)] 2 [Candidatus Neomarinimicrobiota bacterium]